MAAGRRVPARRPARGRPQPRDRRAARGRALPRARLHLRFGPARPGDGAGGGRAAGPRRAHGAAREERVGVALEAGVAAARTRPPTRCSRCRRPSAIPKGDAKTAFSFEWNGAGATAVTSASPVVERRLEAGKAASPKLVVRNTGQTTLYPRLILSGLPPVGRETAAANGLTLDVQYQTPDDKPLDPSRLEQGTDFKVLVNGHELRRARRLPADRALARGRLGLRDPQRPPRPEPRARRRPRSTTRTCATTASTPTSTSRRARRRRVVAGGERRLPRPLLPPDGHGRGDVRRHAQRRAPEGQWVEVVEAGVGARAFSLGSSRRRPARRGRRGEPSAARRKVAGRRASCARPRAAPSAARVLALRPGGAVRRSAVDGRARPRRRAARRLDRGRRAVALRRGRRGAAEVRGRDHLLRGPALLLAPGDRPAGARPRGARQPPQRPRRERRQHAHHAGRPALEKRPAAHAAREAGRGRAGDCA